jgi:hypothetical protein
MTALRPPVGSYVAVCLRVAGYVVGDDLTPETPVLEIVTLDGQPTNWEFNFDMIGLDDGTVRVVGAPGDLYNCGQPPAPHQGAS